MSEETKATVQDEKKLMYLSRKLHEHLGLEVYHIDYLEFLEENVEELDKVTVVNVVERYTTFRKTQAWIVKYKDEYL